MYMQTYMGQHLAAARHMAAECLCFRVRRVARIVTRLYDDALRPLGIQATQLTLLSAIALGGARGARMQALGARLALDATTLSRNLRPLQAAGFVRLERLTSDRRVRLAVLTAAGERLLAEAVPLWRQAQARVAALVGAREADDLRGRLDLVADAAGVPPMPPAPPARRSLGPSEPPC